VKNKFRLILIIIIAIGLNFFVSCRKDEIILKNAALEKTLLPNSLVDSLIQHTAFLDGSSDNIIDKANCILIKLPVSLIVNGVPIVINSPKDFDVIEAIFEDSDTDTDKLSYNFPITIILIDYTEVLINSETQLNSYVMDCNGENEDDDDIECLDFNYPISFTTYNNITEVIDALTLNTDRELYKFIKALNENTIVNIIFPISVTLFDDTLMTINTLDELQIVLEDAINACDEDDDFDFNEDDNTNITEQEFKDLLIACSWEIEEIEINGQNRKSQFNEFYFTFNADGSATAKQNNTVYNGSWTLITDNGLRLSFQFIDFPLLNNTWRISKITTEDDGTRLDLRNLVDSIKLKQECP
jgi:hypothetical protein